MEPDSLRDDLKIQMRESYGRVVYSYTTHLKEIDILVNDYKYLRSWNIVVISLTSCGALGNLLADCLCWKVFLALLSVVSLYFTFYFNEHERLEEIRRHQVVADKLWKIREEYVSILTDLELYDFKELIKKRDNLTEQVGVIYSEAPRTSVQAYEEAKQALKHNEEQFFNPEEIDLMLPAHLRITDKYKIKSNDMTKIYCVRVEEKEIDRN
ncbi:SLATT domain-containing protein [Phascolarctobacterium sp.]|uniref:SLATT domain-containing protein n=1 Tax=Phascolarctobacterium sp. TaxID=2049039 RepID=UPI00386CA6BA